MSPNSRISSRHLFTLMTATLALAFVCAQAAAQSEEVLYSFVSEATTGVSPESGLVMDSSGALYGTLGFGGEYGGGTVFKLTSGQDGSPRTETTIYSFPATRSDGSAPSDLGSLVLDKAGSLYGTTYLGGQFGYGTVFQLTPPASGETWTETILYSFGSGTDAENPTSGLTMAGGALYGTTYLGGESGAGAIFKLAPPSKAGGAWTESVLHSFTGGDDGGWPTVSPAVSSAGIFYGTARFGGLYGSGVVYQLSPPAKGSTAWTETVLHNFPDGAGDGGDPGGGVILDKDGTLYGTAEQSFGSLPYGLIFKLAPSTWEETILYSFTGGSDGAYPEGGLAFDSSGALYGTTTGTGEAGGNHGSVFKLTPPNPSGGAWTETTLHSFTGESDGGTPMDGLLLKGGLLYGTTYEGGSHPRCSCGIVFEVNP